MIKINKLAGAFVAAGALLAVTAPAAHAAPPESFTITETIDFNSPEPPTFTATGPLCPAGTFEDDVIAIGGGRGPNSKINFQLRTVYTCDDGSGTFFAQKHVLVTENEDGSSSNTGPITFHGGLVTTPDSAVTASTTARQQQTAWESATSQVFSVWDKPGR
jgi:hypothetical protein